MTEASARQIDADIYVPQSWASLSQQVLHLAQFGGSVQVIIAPHGGGKTSFLSLLSQESRQLEFLCLSAFDEEGLVDFFARLAAELGLLLPDGAGTGEQISALRSFAQALERERERVVIAIDNAQRLDDAILAALVSIQQGHSDSGFGLHYLFLSEPGLAERIDQLHLLDVSVHDVELPAFTELEFSHLFQLKLGQAGIDPERIASDPGLLWQNSNGLPGAIDDELPHLVEEPEKPSSFSMSGWPLSHFAAIAVLAGALIWALLLRGGGEQKEIEAKGSNSQGVQFELSSAPGEELAQLEASPSVSQAGTILDESQSKSLHKEDLELGSSAEAGDQGADQIQGQSALRIRKDEADLLPQSKASQDLSNKDQLGVIVDAEDAKAKEFAQVRESLVVSSQKSPATAVAEQSQPLRTQSAVVSSSSVATAAQKGLSDAKDPGGSDAGRLALKPKAGAGQQIEEGLLSLSRARLSQMPPGFVLQIMALSKLEALESFVSEQANKDNLNVYKVERSGKALYVLVEGYYADKGSAKAAVKNLPVAQKRGGPWPKSVTTVQSEMR